MGMTEQTYDGAVTAGGDPQTRTVGCLSITKVAVDPDTSNNCYLLRCTDTGEQVLIDAADDASTLLRLVGDGGLARIVTTHQHWDHHRALKEVAEATGAETLAGEPDADAITEQTGVAIDRHLVDGDTVPVGTAPCESSRCAATPRARWPCTFPPPTVSPSGISSPATRSSPVASATPSATTPPSLS